MHEFNLWYALLTIAAAFGALQGTAGFLVYVERKVCAYMQNRVGPNRVGPFGLLQVLADGLKFFLKEESMPQQGDKFIFVLAPCVSFICALLSFAVVPFGGTDNPADTLNYPTQYQFMIAPGIDIGILFIFAVSSLAVYGIILGGWASNSKYSMLGGLRSSAQIISYEIPLGLSILGVVLMTGSLNLETIIWKQASGGVLGWFFWTQPMAFLIFMISAFAECNRLPFDLPESEQELIGGYHTEYNAMKLAFFFIGEYVHMITTSFLMVILFFGGWHLPFIADPNAHWVFKLIAMAFKVTMLVLFYMAIRWTIPRFRFDQLMSLAWKVLIPLSLINLVAVMVVMEFEQYLSPWLLLPISIVTLVGSGLIVSAPPAPPKRANDAPSKPERPEPVAV